MAVSPGAAVPTTFSPQSSKRGDAWKALASAERTSAQCHPPFPDEVTGPRSLVLGVELETEPSSTDACACFLPYSTFPYHRLGWLEKARLPAANGEQPWTGYQLKARLAPN